MHQEINVSIPEKREIPFEVWVGDLGITMIQQVSIPEKREIPFEEMEVNDYVSLF